MENIVITSEVIQKAIAEEVPKQLAEHLKDSYSSPIRKTIEKAIENNLGQIDIMVNEIITKAVSDPKFKEKLGEAVLTARE